jgi:hypothetical protein
MRDVQRLAGNPSTSCYLIETVQSGLIKTHNFSGNIHNMFEWIHTKGGYENVQNAKK